MIAGYLGDQSWVAARPVVITSTRRDKSPR